MKVRDLCQPNVVTVQPGTPVAEAARLMITLGVGSVVVLEHGRVCGILTDRDIVARGVQHGHDLRQMTVADVMTLNPVVIEPDADLPRATVIMADKAIRRLPVVEEDAMGARDPVAAALREAEEAIARARASETHVDLAPQNAHIRRLQHTLAERHELPSRSLGKEPCRYVRILPADARGTRSPRRGDRGFGTGVA